MCDHSCGRYKFDLEDDEDLTFEEWKDTDEVKKSG